jgi:hypothetical protein
MLQIIDLGNSILPELIEKFLVSCVQMFHEELIGLTAIKIECLSTSSDHAKHCAIP